MLISAFLAHWDYNRLGQCYNTLNIASPSSSHPLVDYTYTILTSSVIIISMYMPLALRFSRLSSSALSAVTSLSNLNTGVLQFPLHLYNIFALRASNESFLTSGTTEQQWGFGQIVALVIVGNNIVLLANATQEYLHWKDGLEEISKKSRHCKDVATQTLKSTMERYQSV